uniref:NADH-ubiquinone oxidoreductase chain 2 n=1 Tax=Neoceratodus forsteri TaxID=7892 RepID=A0A343KS40_NEOFS|nr:NADH dehydrogenase subunit 2 [Neoceratodus forsteri]ATL16393.1 NADH dehydrogenase subunit 2 [Neoceratodus forsteri]ATL16406.1 NADH dehydrogenase subunit 2 [Neoceratodus forsteri]ATL16419.1 NADH dehydrogenase subunit 2 [Neoceratodus forsteri]ATL16432.1 NADH dehydrogenase subunit 2 [Neoceratodus forsteri]
MNPHISTTLLLSLGLGTTITFMSSNWLLAWMGLEINTLAIIPMMAKQHHPRAVEATTKYFLTQATASTMILFTSTMNAWTTGEWSLTEMTNQTALTTLTMALAMKIGLAPMHFWLPEVLQGLDLTTGLILSTWQKLAPFAILYQISPMTNQTLLIMLGVTSALAGGWGGLNQTQLRKIMAYSSIAHLGWMVIILHFAPALTMLNLLIYIMMTSTMFLTMKMTSSTTVNVLSTAWTKMPMLAATSMMALLSLSGLPPLTGFMPKWLIIQELSKQNLPTAATIMALSALLSLFFYLRLCYTTTLTTAPNTHNTTSQWRKKTTQMTMATSMMIILTAMLLPITPTIMNML